MSQSVVQVHCSCGKVLKAKRTTIGKTVRCPGCQQPIVIADRSSVPEANVSETSAPQVSVPKASNQEDSFAFLKGGGSESSPGKTESSAGKTEPSAGKTESSTEKTEPSAGKTESVAPRVTETPAKRPAKTKTGAKKTQTLEKESLSWNLADPVDRNEPSTPIVESIRSADEPVGGVLEINAEPTASPSKSVQQKAEHETPPDTKPFASGVAAASSSAARVPSENPRENRYPSLQLIRRIYRIFAYLAMGGAVLFYLGTVSVALGTDWQTGLMAAATLLPILISGAVLGISMLAFSELIQVLLDIQDNTRRIRQ